MDARLYYYLTRSGMEINFVLETKYGIITVEVKNRDRVLISDFCKMKRISDAQGIRWCGGMVVFRGNKIQNFGNNL